MAYRNPPMKPRRFTYTGGAPPHRVLPQLEDIETEDVKSDFKIPLPNKMDPPLEDRIEPKKGWRFPSLSLFQNGITIEEIILIGLIFLILDERIEDEFLLLMLVYILLV